MYYFVSVCFGWVGSLLAGAFNSVLIWSDEDSPTKHYADLYAVIILIKSNVAILTIFRDDVVDGPTVFELERKGPKVLLELHFENRTLLLFLVFFSGFCVESSVSSLSS